METIFLGYLNVFWNGLSLHFFALSMCYFPKTLFPPWRKKREIPRVQIKDDLMLATILLLCAAFTKRASLMIGMTISALPSKNAKKRVNFFNTYKSCEDLLWKRGRWYNLLFCCNLTWDIRVRGESSSWGDLIFLTLSLGFK